MADALIIELLNNLRADINRNLDAAIKLHSEDPSAHPHAHDMDVSAAVEEHLSAAASEIEAAIAEEQQPPTEEPPAEEPPAEEPPPEPTKDEGDTEEKAPIRIHPLHGRIGGAA